jgi:predicted component of type VI protein secretion system
MRRSLLFSLVAAATALLPGCGTVNSLMGGNSEAEAKAAVEWSYAPGAISIELRSDPSLNLYEGEPHTLVLAVVQTIDPNLFKGLLADEAAVARLLATGQSTPPMTAVERVIVEPGRTKTVRIDRAQLAQYFGVVAGYYQLDPVSNARLFRIPVEVKSSGLVVKNRTAAPAPQRVNLVLGAERVMAAEQIAPALPASPATAPPPPGRAGVKPTAQAAPAAPAEPESGPIKIDAKDVRQAADTANAARRLVK